MQSSNSHIQEQDSFLSVLTPRIQADLPAWYGANARLVGSPKFDSRDWSYIVRYMVQVPENSIKAILVKIKHAENMNISQAIVSDKMKQEVKDEYETLVKIRAMFSSGDVSSLFFAIRPLALYEGLNAVIMEEANIRTLKSYFQSPKMFVEGRARKTFEGFLERTGHWLRIFHDQMGRVEEDILFKKSLYQNGQEDLKKIEACARQIDLTAVSDLLSGLYNRYGHVNTPYRFLHEDFHSANVFVTDDGRICSFDPHNRPGPLYLDLAKFITALETVRMQVLTNGWLVPPPRLKTFNEILLQGYFGTEPVDRSVLNLFRLLTLIEKWKENEVKLEQSTGKRRFLYSLGRPQMRGYFLHLVQNIVSQNFRDV